MVNRAKGNEATQVYLMNVEEVENEDRFGGAVQRRNQSFISISRTRAWCSITGTGESPVFDEIEELLNDLMDDRKSISFEVPDQTQLSRQMESDIQETTIEDFS